MIERPRIKRFLTVFPLTEDRWVFRGGVNELCRVDLRNDRARDTFQRMLPLLDGTQRTGDLIARLESEGVDPRAASALLRHLEGSRCLEDAAGAEESPDADHREQRIFFSHFAADGGAGHQRELAESRVAVLADGTLGAALARQLREAGVGEVTSAEPPAGEPAGWDLAAAGIGEPHALAVAPRPGDRALLERIDELSRARRLPWLPIQRVTLGEAWIGPIFVPGETASYRSFETWHRGTVPFFELPPEADRDPAAGAFLPAALEAVAGLAVTEIVKLRTLYQVPRLLGRFLAVDLSSWEIESREVWRIPQLDRIDPPKPAPFPWKDALYGHTSTHERRG